MAQTTLDFSAYIDERSRDFIGREWVFAEIDRWLADPDAPRYFIITGEPGIGKTAIAARLAQTRPDLGAYHFCIARRADTTDPFLFARSLSQQLCRHDGFAAGILKDSGIDVQTVQNIQANYGQVIGAKIETLVVNAPSPTIAFTHTVTEPLKTLYASGFDQPLLILVDALDEAVQHKGSETAVHLLAGAGRLPGQVRFVLTSRLEGDVLRHFEQRQIPHLLLDAGREENLGDVRRYVRGQVAASNALQARLAEQDLPDEIFVQRVTQASQGNFLYVVWLLRAIAEGTQRFDTLEALPQELDGIYREFLRTRPVGRDLRRWREHYRPLLGTLAAAQEPLTAVQLAHLAGLNRQSVQDALLDVQQFLDPIGAGEKRYQLYHQSLVDFLSNEERAGEFWVDLEQVHRQIAAYYQKHYARRWPDCDLYGLRHLPTHLGEARQVETLRQLLFSFDWLLAKLVAAGVNTLIADYDLLADDADVASLQRALRQSAHVVVEDARQLPGQLLGRLLNHTSPEIQALLDEAKLYELTPWLRPLNPSLASPGGALLRRLEHHVEREKWLVASAVLLDDQHAISILSDDTLIIWDLETGLELRTVRVQGLEFSYPTLTGLECIPFAVLPARQRAISTSEDHSLKVWDLGTGADLLTLRGHSGSVNAVATTPDGGRVVSASDDRTIKVWDLETGADLLTLRGHSGSVNAVAITPDGGRVVSASDDRTVKLWDLGSGADLLTLRGHSEGVNTVAITPDGREAISASKDHTVRVWDLREGLELYTLQEDTKSDIRVVVITPDGKRVICGFHDGRLEVWDLASKEKLSTLKGHTTGVVAVAVTPDSKRALSTSSTETLVWHLGRTTQHPSHGDAHFITAVTTTPDGKYAASGSQDGILRIWDLASGTHLFTLTGHKDRINAIAAAQDSQRIASAASDGLVKVWDLRRKTEILNLTGHTDAVTSIVVAPDDQCIVSASRDTTLKIWNLQSGDELHTLKGHSEEVNAVVITPDGRRAISASKDKTLKVWNLVSGAELHTLRGHNDEVVSVGVVPDGRRCVSGSLKDLIVWDLEKGTLLLNLRGLSHGHTHWVKIVRTLPDGQHVISASLDSTLRLWRLDSQGETLVCRHNFAVIGAVITPDGRYAISASEEGKIRVWDLEAQQEIARFTGEGRFTACDIGSDGRTIVVGDYWGNMYFLRLEGVN